MSVYIFLPILFLLFHFVDLFTKKVFMSFLFFACFLILLFVAGFRECGYDYYSYKNLFDSFQGDNWISASFDYNTEIGFAFLNHLVGNYHLLIFLVTLAILATQLSFIYLNSERPFLVLFFYLGLFFYNSLMGQFRQGLALGIVLWAIYYRNDNRRFYLLIILATLFHYTAIIALLVKIIPAKIQKTYIYVLLLLFSFCLKTILSNLPYTILYSISYFESKISYYSDDERLIVGINTAMLIRFFLFFLCLKYKDLLIEIKNMDLYLNLYFVAIFMYVSFSFMPELASRGALYFTFFEIILSVNIIHQLRFRKIGFLILIIFIVFSVYRQSREFTNDDGIEAFLPYSNWLLN